MKKISKKLLAVLCLLALCCTLLAGCGTGGSTGETVELSGILATSWDTDALEACLSKYEEETGNTITLEVIPDDQFTDLMTVRLSTESDVPDLFFGNPIFTEEQTAKWFQPLDGMSFIKNLDQGHLVNKYQLALDGKLYGAPYGGASCLGLMYNKAIFKEAGVEVPLKSYDELLDACEKIKAAGYTPISFSNAESWTAQIMYLGNQFSLMSEDEQKALRAGTLSYADMPGYVEAFGNILNLLEKGYVNKDYMSTTMDMSIEDVATGECAMSPAGDWSFNPMITNHGEEAGDEVGMIPIPVYQDELYVNIGTSSKYVWATNTGDSTKEAAAKAFIEWMMSEENVQYYYEREPGICPQSNIEVSSNAWDTEMAEYAKTYPLTELSKTLQGFSGGDTGQPVQKLLGGYTVQEALEWYYEDCRQLNIAAGTPGF